MVQIMIFLVIIEDYLTSHYVQHKEIASFWQERAIHHCLGPFICLTACFTYLEHIQVTTLVALTDYNLADQVGILSHQHVLEGVDLNQRQKDKFLVCRFMK